MIVLEDIEQNTEAWLIEKAGKPSASKFNMIVTTKGEPSKQRQDYLYQLAGESLTGRCEESYQSYAMQVGIEREAEARAFFEALYGEPVRQVGVVYRDKSKSVLCSPDGLMTDCGLELKNPMLKTHVKYLLDGKLPTDYFQQVQGSMYITGFKFWWFMSYWPGMPPFVLLVKRDDEFITKLDKEVELFCRELRETIKKLRKL